MCRLTSCGKITHDENQLSCLTDSWIDVPTFKCQDTTKNDQTNIIYYTFTIEESDQAIPLRKHSTLRSCLPFPTPKRRRRRFVISLYPGVMEPDGWWLEDQLVLYYWEYWYRWELWNMRGPCSGMASAMAVHWCLVGTISLEGDLSLDL